MSTKHRLTCYLCNQGVGKNELCIACNEYNHTKAVLTLKAQIIECRAELTAALKALLACEAAFATSWHTPPQLLGAIQAARNFLDKKSSVTGDTNAAALNEKTAQR